MSAVIKCAVVLATIAFSSVAFTRPVFAAPSATPVDYSSGFDGHLVHVWGNINVDPVSHSYGFSLQSIADAASIENIADDYDVPNTGGLRLNSATGDYQGQFIIEIEAQPYFLSADILVILSGGATSVQIQITRELDMAEQGQVNIADLATVAYHMNCTIGSSCYNPIADVNADGTINIQDLALVSFYFTGLAYSPSSLQFSISADPYTATVDSGGTLTSNIWVDWNLGGGGPLISLTVAGCPPSSSSICSFDYSSGVGLFNRVLTIPNDAPPGTYRITVTATSATTPAVSRSVVITLTVSPLSVAAYPSSMTLGRNEVGATKITSYNYGVSSSVSLSQTGCPPGTTCSFNVTSGTSTFSSGLIVTTSSSTPLGSYMVTVTASGGGVTSPPTTVMLTVTPYGFKINPVWSGYEVAQSSNPRTIPIYEITSTWVVPEVINPINCNTRPQCDLSVWIGLTSGPGGTDPNCSSIDSADACLLQMGTDSSNDGTGDQYLAWYEVYTGGSGSSFACQGLTVSPGDSVTASIKSEILNNPQGLPYVYDLSLKDNTNNQVCHDSRGNNPVVNLYLNYGFPSTWTPYLAEYIAERGVNCTGCGLAHLSQFTTSIPQVIAYDYPTTGASYEYQSGSQFVSTGIYDGVYQGGSTAYQMWNGNCPNTCTNCPNGCVENISLGDVLSDNSFTQTWLTSNYT